MALRDITLLELAKYKDTTIQSVLKQIEEATGRKLPLQHDYPVPEDCINCIAPELLTRYRTKKQRSKEFSGNYQQEGLELFNSGGEKLILGFVKVIREDSITVEFLVRGELTMGIEKFSNFPDVAVNNVVELYCQIYEESTSDFHVICCMPYSSWSLRKIREAYEHEDTIKVKVLHTFENGLVANVFGRKGVIHNPQITADKVENLMPFVNKILDVRITGFKENPDGSPKIVLSHRIVLEAEKEALGKKTFLSLKEGDKCIGTVTNITDFGAFVEIENLTGLIPKRFLSWHCISHPREVVKVNDRVQVVVSSMREEGGKPRVKLDYRPYLWESVTSEIERGSVLIGKICKIEDSGVFVELTQGVNAFLPLSEMTKRRYYELQLSSQSINKEIEVVVTGIDHEEHKINLSLLPLIENKWDDIEARYRVNCIYAAKVISVRENEVWAELEEGVEGIIPYNELRWPKNDLPQKELSYNQDIQVVIKGIKINERIMSLSLKQATPNPWDMATASFEKATIIKVRIEDVSNKKITVSTVDEFRLLGFISLQEVTWIKNYEDLDISELPKKGEVIEAKILNFKPKRFELQLSIRQLTDDPWAQIEIDTKVQGTVTELIENVGLKITLSNGLIGISQELNLAEHIGQLLDFKIIGYNKPSYRISLSHKRLTVDEYKDNLVKNFFARNILAN